MKSFVLLLVVATLAHGSVLPGNNVYGYLKNSVERANKLRQAEEDYLNQRIIGGVPAGPGQYPHQAGLITDIIGITNGNGICGGSLISASRVLTAAHCWFDGLHQVWRLTVVLGSVTLFSGGERIQTSAIAVHPSYSPVLARNDIAAIYLPNPVAISNTIAPVALPQGEELLETFENSNAIASGFGATQNDGSVSPFLNHVNLNVITNDACRFAFPLILQDSNICTSGLGNNGVCGGDSGGPLVVDRNGRRILIGVTSFGSALGCESAAPSAFARVTSFNSFILEHLG